MWGLDRKTVVVVLVAVLGWCGSVIGAVWYAASDRAEVGARITSLERIVQDHEQRMRALENIAADVRWLRAHFDREPDRR